MIEDDIGEEGFGADGAGVEQFAAADGVGIFLKDRLGVGTGGPWRGIGDAEEDGDIFVGVEAIGDEKGDHDHVGLGGDFVPFGDERFFFHVGAEDFGVEAKGLDAFDFAFGGDGGVIVEAGAVADDEEANGCGIDVGGDLGGAVEEEVGHAGVVPHGLAIFEGEAIAMGDGAIEAEFAGDDGIGEITFADEIGDEVDFIGADHVEDLAVAGFFFPEGGVDFGEDLAIDEGGGVIESGGTGIGVDRGSVADDDESAVRLGKHR